MKALPRSLQKYVDYMAKEGAPRTFAEIVRVTSPGLNTFRFLEKRGLIENVIKSYKKGDIYTSPRMPQYILTLEGLSHVTRKARGGE